MGISIEELRKLEKDSYQILDIRNERFHMEQFRERLRLRKMQLTGIRRLILQRNWSSAAAEESIVWKWQRHWKKKVLMQSV